jgi:hypothetical protein
MIGLAVLLILIASPVAADLYGDVTASSDGSGLISISGDVYTGPIDPVPEDYIDLVIVRSMHGTCGVPVMITSQSWPIADPMYHTYIEWTEDAPSPGIMYKYEFMVRDQAGDLHGLMGYPYNWAYISYGEAVATRGRFNFLGEFDECEIGCWTSQPGCVYEENLPAIDEAQMIEWIFSGQVIDIYGSFRFDEMWPNCEIQITRLEEHDGACGPIPNHKQTWGHIKATYR